MKKDKSELDIDIIGGVVTLTREEEKLISHFINARKQKYFSKRPTQKAKSKN